jgi:hypothetical protein
MRDWASEIPAPESPEILRAIVNDPTLKFAKILSETGQVRDITTATAADQAVPQLVSDADNNFLDGLRLLIEEIRERLMSLPDNELRHSMDTLLSENVHTLAARFDSFTEAWDHLVILKFEASIPDRRSRKIDAWFMSVVGLAERFVRDVIGVTILLGGRDLIAEPLLACFASAELDMPHPTPEQLIRSPNAEAAVTEVVMNFMDRGSRNTMLYAKEFANALNASLFPPRDLGFRPGVLDRLTFLDGDAENALTQIFDLRHSIVHETTRELRSASNGPVHELLYELDLESLKLLPDLLCALCFGLSVRILVAVGDRVDHSHPGLVSGLRFQLSGELRVLLKQLLTAERYELSWAIAQTALEVEPTGPAMMVRINSYFARLQFDHGRMDMAEIRALDVGNLPRYRLLKRCLLNQLRREDMEPILDQAVSSGDMSFNELLTWPALRPVRQCRWWNAWVQRHQT